MRTFRIKGFWKLILRFLEKYKNQSEPAEKTVKLIQWVTKGYASDKVKYFLFF
jgi:hypothetical protein